MNAADDRDKPIPPPAPEPPSSESSSLKDETTDLGETRPPQVAVPLPRMIARYRVERVLGSGGFGCVYLARDEQLDRLVAVKVPRTGSMTSERVVQRYLEEARTLARLDHPNIVPVFDVGHSEQYPCYLVSKFIEGSNLARRLETRRLTPVEAARHVAVIAEALDHAHQRGLYHRDIKPANILVDSRDTPYLTDFGLALKEEELGTGPRFIGSPFYMSPEQARGEGHLVDGRTDIFSLGVVLYEALTGDRPFQGDTPQEVLHQVQSRDARPPRDVDASIPEELERICLKAMAKRASHRYATAEALAEDLRWFLESHGGHAERRAGAEQLTTSPDVVPKGLRSFDANDFDFFPRLLPGPWDREGLPESIRFWKHRIEERRAGEAFRVGLIYGPSGCGKSSLVKAGLLPRLDRRVVSVYVEAGGQDTAARLVRSLSKGRPELSEHEPLKNHLSAFRRGAYLDEDQKLLLVIDQFEQHLHSRSANGQDELAGALRQCDGRRVQCLLLIRDDFWMAMTEFMRELEVRIVEGRNSAPLDLFDPRHARNVLAQFGRAYDRLPLPSSELSGDQAQFLDEAVAGLCESGKVIPVRLSLFAEMIKGRPWTPETLDQLGGMEGVGASFLEESFSATTAPPEHRRHQKAARAVLAALLPEHGTQITGHVRSYGELLDVSGYAQRLDDFDRLLQILDEEVRLIAPVNREGVATGEEAEEESEDAGEHTRRTIAHLKETKRSLRQRSPARYYKLTHDYLVPSLRNWLARKQRETRRGRAQLRLGELAAIWNNTPDNRFLPGWWDACSIWLLSDRRSWGRPQRKMMRRAAAYYGLRSLVLAAALLLLAVGGLRIRSDIRSAREDSRQQQAKALVDALLFAPAGNVESLIDSLQGLENAAEPLLSLRFHDEEAGFRVRMRAALGLAACGNVPTDFLVESLAECADGDVQNFARALRGAPGAADKLFRRGQRETEPRLRARFATVLLDLQDPRLAREILAYGADPTARSMLIHNFLAWRDDLDGFAALLRAEQDAALRSGLCAVVGLAEPRLLLGESGMELLQVIAEIYRTDPRAEVHSAAGQVLRVHAAVLGGIYSPAALPEATGDPPAPREVSVGADELLPRLPHPPRPLPRDAWQEAGADDGDAAYVEYLRRFYAEIRPAKISPRADWYQNRWGITLLKVPPASGLEPFYLADREVTRQLFTFFAEDPLYPDGEKPVDWQPLRSGQESVPVQNVSWEDAVLFCNWLSVRTGRQPCYVRAAAQQDNAESGAARKELVPLSLDWLFQPSANGYRLPTEAEWEHACRGGTTTAYAFGEDLELLPAYAAFAGNARQPKAGGTRLPNAFGLFDMHGNLSEWCRDGKALRGGSYESAAGDVSAAARGAADPARRLLTQGFRVAHPAR